MRPISELKQDFEVSSNLGDIIDVLKTSALIQFRSFQLKEKPNEECFFEVQRALKIAYTKDFRHPYIMERDNLPTAIVVVTSDEGLLGELNTLLINTCLDQSSPQDEIIVLGERGTRYLEDVNKNFVFLPGISDEVTLKEVEILKDYLTQGAISRFGRVNIIYPHFVSLTQQKVTIDHLLPYNSIAEEDTDRKADYLTEITELEPNRGRVLEALIEMALSCKILDIFWSSKLSEFAARIMHLEGSTQELGLLNQKLSFEYFRQVHNLRDKVIREISASKNLLGRRANRLDSL
ncbi:MAG: F0F1 ATP synthase subunit gamma [Candidatus Omnitrophica bacterium]|nr:F0F1 ATP synthase subunit gamma [Candidatus Omnitrophota bacterium]